MPPGLKGCCWGTWLIYVLPYIETAAAVQRLESSGNNACENPGRLRTGQFRYGGAVNLTVTRTCPTHTTAPATPATTTRSADHRPVTSPRTTTSSNFGNSIINQSPIYLWDGVKLPSSAPVHGHGLARHRHRGVCRAGDLRHGQFQRDHRRAQHDHDDCGGPDRTEPVGSCSTFAANPGGGYPGVHGPQRPQFDAAGRGACLELLQLNGNGNPPCAGHDGGVNSTGTYTGLGMVNALAASTPAESIPACAMAASVSSRIRSTSTPSSRSPRPRVARSWRSTPTPSSESLFPVLPASPRPYLLSVSATCCRAWPRVARVEDNPWHPRGRPGCHGFVPEPVRETTVAYRVSRVRHR